ncbi:MAG: hypothetical protein DRN08_02165 [Thermoplasmata archaeon]|nr:MAG: hypothetical protein DRN05_03070 [Thermoplasmata archaeon]RLF35980.1 MAG: hypothetical protein DRN08_02165 [Thermoplasmata archaeon]
MNQGFDFSLRCSSEKHHFFHYVYDISNYENILENIKYLWCIIIMKLAKKRMKEYKTAGASKMIDVCIDREITWKR